MRGALRLRLEWLPHMYSASRRAYEGAPSLLRPLYLEWPEAEEAYAYRSQYALGGSSVLVTRVGFEPTRPQPYKPEPFPTVYVGFESTRPKPYKP